MRLFVNKNQHVTAIIGQNIYELHTTLVQSFQIVEAWLRGEMEFATREQRIANAAIEAIINSNCTVGNKQELEANDDARLRMFNVNVNPTGQASIRWHIPNCPR